MTVTIRQCCRAAIVTSDVAAREFFSPLRHRRIAQARFLAMWLARIEGGKSLKQIGLALRRDHTTVLHGINQAHELMQTDEDFCRRLRAAWRSLGRG